MRLPLPAYGRFVVVALRPSHVVGAFRQSGVRPACPTWRGPVTLSVVG
jgi:hypothetical protein